MSGIDWIRRWEDRNIGFHEGVPNVHLVAHFDRLGVQPGGRVLVPFCGKSVDMHWLLGGGYHVIGAEISEMAISELFDELGVAPHKSNVGPVQLWAADGIEIFVGDLFELTAELVGPVDAVYDRAAFVAQPEDERGGYAEHVIALAGGAPQLLITYSYDQSLMSGPPFSIPDEEVHSRYGGRYAITKIDEAATGGVRGVPADEGVWLLTPR